MLKRAGVASKSKKPVAQANVNGGRADEDAAIHAASQLHQTPRLENTNRLVHRPMGDLELLPQLLFRAKPRAPIGADLGNEALDPAHQFLGATACRSGERHNSLEHSASSFEDIVIINMACQALSDLRRRRTLAVSRRRPGCLEFGTRSSRSRGRAAASAKQPRACSRRAARKWRWAPEGPTV